jgi:hypothetical protein
MKKNKRIIITSIIETTEITAWRLGGRLRAKAISGPAP